MDAENIIILTVAVILVVAVGVPLINSAIAQLAGIYNYNEQLNMNASVPYTMAHDVDSVNGVYSLAAYNRSNSTTDPGNTSIILAAVPATTSALTVDGGNIGDVSINGHYLGTLNGSGGPYTFLVPRTYLHAGANAVRFQ